MRLGVKNSTHLMSLLSKMPSLAKQTREGMILIQIRTLQSVGTTALKRTNFLVALLFGIVTTTSSSALPFSVTV